MKFLWPPFDFDILGLGNPPWQLPGPQVPGANFYKGACRKASGINTDAKGHGYQGYCLFAFQTDQSRYDTGFHILVQYVRNKELPDCAENTILDDQGFFPNELFYNEIIPLVNLVDPILHVIFSTVDHRITVTQKPPPTITYPLIPTDIGLPIVSISSLTCHQSLTLSTVDLVEANGAIYVFKHGTQLLDVIHTVSQPSDDIPINDNLVQEIACLNRFQSPFIITPLFVVSDTSDPLRCRGFLMPFLPAGSLTDVLAELRKLKCGDALWDPPVLPSKTSAHNSGVDLNVEVAALDIGGTTVGTGDAALDAEASVADNHYPKLLDWSVKHLWASDIARGVVLLHERSLPSGDLKLGNVLLGPDGRICHIDIFFTGSTETYIPPEHTFGPPTVAQDIFAMGLMLWALSEELEDFERNYWEVPSLFWQEGEGATPSWYRELVESCLHIDADKRPSAQTVLDTLTNAA